MFNFLKEKLKSWVSKNKEPEETLEKIPPKIQKTPKPKEKTKKQSSKKETKNKKQPKQSKSTERKKQPEQLIQEIKEQTEEKSGFFGIFKKKKQAQEPKETERKEVEPIKKFNPATQTVEPDIEETEQLIQEQEKQTQEKEEKQGFFSRFRKKLDYEKFEELFSELELILLQNNVAYEAVHSIKKSLEQQLVGNNLSEVNLEEALKIAIEKILINPPNFLEEVKSTLKIKQPFVIALIGINGSGKTTTIAKLTNYFQKNNLSVCLAAADTFRAASIEQLQQHADKLKVHLIKKDYGADPASIGFDAIQYAKKHHIDIVLIDTAGRMQNKDSLMTEMEKIVRINKPDMKIFVGESITGNDATEQARAFNNAINLTGIILSKADVDEKGGTAISISCVTKKPILFLGTGQSYDDLEVFNKDKLIEKLGL